MVESDGLVALFHIGGAPEHPGNLQLASDLCQRVLKALSFMIIPYILINGFI